MNKVSKTLFDALWYVIVFLLVQVLVQLIAVAAYSYAESLDFNTVYTGIGAGKYSKLIVLSSVFSGVVTLTVFNYYKWAIISRHYLASRPWGVLLWVSLLTLGTILPAEWIYERLSITMAESTQALFDGIMREQTGYLAIGIFAPLVEELVFRGAVLRSLLMAFDRRWHWLPIVISAFLFGLVHMNMAQGIHAFVIGLLLGWMYYRTSSIIPGILLHWINNTVAYLMFHLVPQFGDGKVIDFFHGDESLMYKGLGCSLLIMLPAIYQLAVRMKKQ